MKSAEKDRDELKGCVAILAAILLYPFLWTLNGWAFKVMWVWFVVPLGAPTISVPQGVGFVAVAMLLRGHRKVKGTFEKALPAVIARSVVIPLYILLIGSIAHWFMS